MSAAPSDWLGQASLNGLRKPKLFISAAFILFYFFIPSLWLPPSARASGEAAALRRRRCLPGPGRWASLGRDPLASALLEPLWVLGLRRAPPRRRGRARLRGGEPGWASSRGRQNGPGGGGGAEPISGGGASAPGQVWVPRDAGQWGGWGRVGGALIGGNRRGTSRGSGVCGDLFRRVLVGSDWERQP